jgi:hypothetical protein
MSRSQVSLTQLNSFTTLEERKQRRIYEQFNQNKDVDQTVNINMDGKTEKSLNLDQFCMVSALAIVSNIV